MIDILLAAYNGERYIGDQLESLMRQTEQEITVIIRDDGSTDRTLEIVEEWQKRFPGKILLVSDSEVCRSPACNFMQLIRYEAEQRQAEYVCFCDQDDYWFAEKAEEMLAVMKKTEAESPDGSGLPVLVFSDYEVADEKLHPMKVREDSLQIARFHQNFERLLVQNYITGCTMMINRAALLLAGEYDSRMLMHDWWIALYVSAMGRIVHLPEKLMYYRQHGDNDVGAKDVKSMRYRLSKVFDPAVKKSMSLYAGQAQLLRERHIGAMPHWSRQALNQFLALQRYPKLKRMAALVKGGYLKSDAVRTAG